MWGGNPLSFTDPTGEIGIAGAAFGAGFSIATQVAICLSLGGDLSVCLKCINVIDVIISAGVGAISPGFWKDVVKPAWKARKVLVDSGGPGRLVGQMIKENAKNNAAGKALGLASKLSLPSESTAKLLCGNEDECAPYRLGAASIGFVTSLSPF
jgi:hypothetical protein